MDVEKIGKTIAYLRKRAGYTQKELADRIGISDKAVSKWERGQGLPEIGYLRKLSILLDTDTDSLLAGDVAHHRKDWMGIIILNENPYNLGAGTIIYDKPLIYYLLSYFLLVGIKDLYVACNADDAKYIVKTLGTGEDYGVNVHPVIGGLKDVVAVITSVIPKSRTGDVDNRFDNVMIVYGRCILYGVDQTRFFQKAMVNREHMVMLALPKKMQESSISLDENKCVLNSQLSEVRNRRLRTQYDFSPIPILFIPISMLRCIVEARTVENYIEEQSERESVYIETLDRGFVEIEVDDWNNVQEASTFIKIVQDKCGMNVYCIEEVAWRRGMISLEQLRLLGEAKSGTEYGDYILNLYERVSTDRLVDNNDE